MKMPAWVLPLLAAFLSVAGQGIQGGRAAVVSGIGVNFTASTFGVDSSFLPPDPDGAVGPGYFVEFINGRFSVFNKTDGSLVKTLSDQYFWNEAGVSLPRYWDLTDPRIIYDASSQRWFATQVDYDGLQVANTNHILFAVSTNSDPTGGWKGFLFASAPGLGYFADFPTLGLDNQKVYLSGDLFDASNNPAGPTLFSIPKYDLLSNSPSISNLTWLGQLDYASNGTILQPAVCTDGSGFGRILAAGDLRYNFPPHTNLVGSWVQKIGGSNSMASALISVPPYAFPFKPVQPDLSTNLDDGDARLSAAVYCVGGVLYAVQNIQAGDRPALRWYRVRAWDYSLLESGTITDPVLGLFYPSIAANAAGTVIIAFNGCSASNFVNSYAVVGETIDGVTSFGSRILLKAGAASYQHPGTDGISRWGDYSATSVDPADSKSFWTIQMFPSGPSTWSTQVTQIRTAKVVLSIAAVGTNVVLSWPKLVFGYQLEGSGDLQNGVWNDVTQSPTTNGDSFSVSLPVSTAPQFFRLGPLQ